MRPHWQSFISSLERLGRVELFVRWENARRIIREHGVTYNVYGDPQGMDRPWELDMLPLLIPSEDWRKIEAGLMQRSKLFNLILADIYGPQRLLLDGHLPPALVYANPNFLRPCCGLPVPGGIYLHLHAADMARSADGQWWVIADRTQAPSGAGYALENRIVLSRTFPEEYRNCQAQRLASFFSMQRDTLRSLAARNCDNPSVVLLTPGPYNETYFEHDFLSRYLGFTLVEGGDLTVRDRKVFLKTLEGLRPIDVILRRVDDTFCDPLELRGDSVLGVPGLVESVRAGNVTVANALGSGLLENPAFMAFLPGLCRHLLGEDLKLPSLATWWCGHEKEMQYVIDHLHEMVIKPAFGLRSSPPFFGSRMGAEERKKLAASIRENPYRYVGQEQTALSTAPVWANGAPEPRPLVVRSYIAAAGDSFAVMPGGLTRISNDSGEIVVSMQHGGGSKDTWILADGPVNMVSLLTASGHPVRSGASSAELPSRVADNLFWLGRYTERLEGTARLLRCLATRLLDESSADGSPELFALARMLVRLDLLPARFAERFPAKDLEQELFALFEKEDRPGSVRQLLNRVRGIVSVTRDRFSADTWTILSKLNLDGRSRQRRRLLSDTLNLLNTIIIDMSAFSGMEMENMTRGLGWRFLEFGRRLERASRIVQWFRAALCPEPQGTAILEPLLELSDSLMTYRRRYFAGVQAVSVLELLLLDEGNPRSLAFQLTTLREHGRYFPREADLFYENEERRVLGLLLTLRDSSKFILNPADNAAANRALEVLLNDCMAQLSALGHDFTNRYFSHTVASVS